MREAVEAIVKHKGFAAQPREGATAPSWTSVVVPGGPMPLEAGEVATTHETWLLDCGCAVAAKCTRAGRHRFATQLRRVQRQVCACSDCGGKGVACCSVARAGASRLQLLWPPVWPLCPLLLLLLPLPVLLLLRWLQRQLWLRLLHGEVHGVEVVGAVEDDEHRLPRPRRRARRDGDVVLKPGLESGHTGRAYVI